VAAVKPTEKAVPKPASNTASKSDPSDIIDVALQARKDKKGELTEAEAKKSNITVPKPLKLAVKGNDLMVDILQKEIKPEPVPAPDRPSTGQKKTTSEQAPSAGLKKPLKPEESKVTGKITLAVTKEVINNEGAKPDSADPIEIAVFARK
jgi:hypothetical protein